MRPCASSSSRTTPRFGRRRRSGWSGAGFHVTARPTGGTGSTGFARRRSTSSCSTSCCPGSTATRSAARSAREPRADRDALGPERHGGRRSRTRARRRRLRHEAVRAGRARRAHPRGAPARRRRPTGERDRRSATSRSTRRRSAARKGGEEVALTATEFRLLLELARRPGQVFTRELLLERVWNYEYLGDSRLVDVAVQRLRAKIEDDPRQPQLIVDGARRRLPLRAPAERRPSARSTRASAPPADTRVRARRPGLAAPRSRPARTSSCARRGWRTRATARSSRRASTSCSRAEVLPDGRGREATCSTRTSGAGPSTPSASSDGTELLVEPLARRGAGSRGPPAARRRRPARVRARPRSATRATSSPAGRCPGRDADAVLLLLRGGALGRARRAAHDPPRRARDRGARRPGSSARSSPGACSRPSARASTAAHSLAEGLLDTRLPVESADEFGAWAASFNEMAEALEAKITALSRGAGARAALHSRRRARAAHAADRARRRGGAPGRAGRRDAGGRRAGRPSSSSRTSRACASSSRT